jgi:hypothetical protein
MRFLDEQLAARLGFSVTDFATPLDRFCNLPFGDSTVLIVENEMTFLTLPLLPRTVAVFGAGDAAAMLANVAWLNLCRVFYWGDLDSHGFEILSNLRRSFPHVVSLMMDENTFGSHLAFVVKAAATRTKEKLMLTDAEQVFHDRLTEEKCLLEQERISNEFSKHQLWRAIAM